MLLKSFFDTRYYFDRNLLVLCLLVASSFPCFVSPLPSYLPMYLHLLTCYVFSFFSNLQFFSRYVSFRTKNGRRIETPYVSTSKLNKLQFLSNIFYVLFEIKRPLPGMRECKERVLKERNYRASEFVKFSAFIFLHSTVLTR